ncbi:hypothetical protein DFH06DRAFT_1391787, partial [Mycena polygramma]
GSQRTCAPIQTGGILKGTLKGTHSVHCTWVILIPLPMARLTLSLTLALAFCFFLLLLASPGVSAVELKPKRVTNADRFRMGLPPLPPASMRRPTRTSPREERRSRRSPSPLPQIGARVADYGHDG